MDVLKHLLSLLYPTSSPERASTSTSKRASPSMTYTSPFFSLPGWTSGDFNGSHYRYFAHKAASDKPTILLLHGFPSGPLSFRSLLPLLQEKGYGIIMPELIGYGESDKETAENLVKLERKKISADLIALLDHENIDGKVVVFGHDHGSPLASSFVRFYPERTSGLVSVSMSYTPHPATANIDGIHSLLVPVLGYTNWGYWKTYCQPHAAKLIEDHLDSFLAIMYPKDPDVWRTHFVPTGVLEPYLLADYKPEMADYMTPEALEELKGYFAHYGAAGGLAWYNACMSETLNVAEYETSNRLSFPYLFIATTKDAACPPIMATGRFGADQWCDDVTVKEVETGHWVCEEDPKGVVAAVEDWLVAKKLA